MFSLRAKAMLDSKVIAISSRRKIVIRRVATVWLECYVGGKTIPPGSTAIVY